MDFARKQLEKYGWTSGKGLGKNENGISEALKPKLKRSVTGVGHDLASDFTEHWWNNLYNKAAKNVEVEEVNGKVKKFKCKDTNFEITNNEWQIKKSGKGENAKKQYGDFFVKTAILSNDGSKLEKINKSDSEDEDASKDVKIVKLTDEELFAACEGRTAHKGARHGLKALGKLARIEQQEQMLLNQAKYNGYSRKTKEDLNNKEDNICNSPPVILMQDQGTGKKKKKRKHDELKTSEVPVISTFQDSNEIKESDIETETKVDNKKKAKRKKNVECKNSEEKNKIKVVTNEETNENIEKSQTILRPEDETDDIPLKKHKKKKKK